MSFEKLSDLQRLWCLTHRGWSRHHEANDRCRVTPLTREVALDWGLTWPVEETQ